MKRITTLVLLLTLFSSCEVMSQLPRTGGGFTEAEAGQGIKEALAQGLGRAVSTLNRTDGFFGSQLYKLLLPPDAQRVERTMRQLGLGPQVDRAILQINRGAEDAVGYAAPIFTDAIRQMTLQDAIGIVRGPNNAATTYFKEKTTARLMEAFRPVVQNSLDKVEATRYYSDLITAYNRFPTTRNKINPDLTSYVVEKAVEALFDQIAQEEAEIRANPLKRTSDILQKVFGGR
ncbi:MAG: DUF4197 domain-containing protein [Lacibacter sp.]